MNIVMRLKGCLNIIRSVDCNRNLILIVYVTLLNLFLAEPSILPIYERFFRPEFPPAK